jgi:hypothetical protein
MKSADKIAAAQAGDGHRMRCRKRAAKRADAETVASPAVDLP